ncbi:pyrroloquinoline quinone biosynthesis protein PqqB [Limibaculum sp. M0105]|uniref:Coenzyme PQQ synthesis protein B n=1 Tax=Thermohalobaculum xanthum TaxID=2753746 RepID=A0A8J7M7S2_9RHOB|nr:pyrroloquinoline quinone biosynthesis protein PqqB [Thermohalobaculum xanthum]MBK0399863.1 pyrroloquinoline quinone biosynthesis protein PqqB [Thermohalobaculum xanthum]
MTSLRAVVLGAAAGGGLPQWNCGCTNCMAARRGEIPAQTQSSVAVSANGADWVVLNASPDIGRQLVMAPVLHPTGPRNVPLRAVVLTNGDIDHVAGLLTLREKQAFTLWMTHGIADVIAANPIFDALDRELVVRRAIALGEAFEPAPGLAARLFAVPGKVPLYLEGSEETLVTDLEGEQTVGVEIAAGGRRACYIPGCARMTLGLRARLEGADLVFFDGTLWRDDEMIRLGLGKKTGARMGHLSMDGENGSIAAFRDLRVGRKVFVHMNNSNPVLDPRSAERRMAEAAGWTVGHDGMEIAI